MESDEKNLSSSPTRVLYIPKLPLSLANWNKLKTHFSQYGKVINVVLSPQTLSCTVRFETVDDARHAKSEGCIWKNREFYATYCKDNHVLFDPRSVIDDEVLGYSELDTLWSDTDVEMFGVESSSSEKKLKALDKTEHKRKVKLGSSKLKPDNATLVEAGDGKVSVERKFSKSKPAVEKTSPKGKLSSERKRDILPLFPVTKKHKEAGLDVSEKLLKLTKKRAVASDRIANNLISSSNDKVLLQKIRKKIRDDLLQNTENKRSTPSKPIKEELYNDQQMEKPVLSLKEKFMLLEERDRLIRKTLTKNSNVKIAKAITGTCPDMCPEKERIMREYRRLVSIYEMVPGTQEMDHSIAIKAYVRSSADQEEPLPHELRPEPVLSMTMGYLISRIMPLIEEPDVNVSEWYDFCWDRLRGIRKDVIQQQLSSLETVRIMEQCARFHICCYDRFWGADPSIFDEKINTENLMNCLQSLRHMYEDLGKEKVKCPNEAEFNAYMILLNMKTGDLMATYQLFSESLQKEEGIQIAVKLYLALNNSMYSQFFKLVRNTTYLNACLLQRYFYHVRLQALQAIAKAYCPPNKGGTIPLKQMKKMLKFDTAEDTELFCEGHGILLKDNRRDFSLYRNDFFFPETKIIVPVSSSLVTDKRLPLIQAVIGDGYYHLRSFMKSFKKHKIHSSFTDGKLNKTASDASDQKIKLSKMLLKTPDSETSELTETDEDVTDAKMEKSFKEDEYEERGQDGDKYLMEVDVGETMFNQENVAFPQSDKENELSITKRIDATETDSDSVSRKQSKNSTTFKFDLKSAVGEPQTNFIKQSSDSQYGSANGNIFGAANTSTDNQLKQSRFNLKINFSGQSDKYPEPCDKQNNLFKPFKLPFHLEDNIKEKTPMSTSLDANKAVGNKSSSPVVKSTGFTFTLEPKIDANSFSSDEVCTDLSSSEKKADDSIISSSFVEQSIPDIVSMKQHSLELSERNQLSTPFSFDANKSSYEDTEGNRTEKRTDEISFVAESTKSREEEKEDEIRRKLREDDDRVMKKLKKDLRRRLKVLTARHFARKWKQKVEKIKLNREEFPLLLCVPPEQHESIWGTAVNKKSFSVRSLLNRLSVKRCYYKTASLILHDNLHNALPKYLGNEVAENIISNNSLKLGLRDFNIPFYWKLVVSVPLLEQFFVDKFNDWLKKLFYKSGELGCVTEEMTSQNVPVHYCVNLVSGSEFKDEKDQIVGMSSLIFFNIVGVEDSNIKSKRFQNLLSANKDIKPITFALVNIGKDSTVSNAQLIKKINTKARQGKIIKWEDKYWNDFESVVQVVEFLTSSIDLSNDIRVSTLSSLFSRTADNLVNVLECSKLVSDEFNLALRNPNCVIKFYNSFLEKLQELISNSNFKDYDIVPPEFKNFIQYLNRPGETFPIENGFKKSRRPNIDKSFSKVKLPYINPWPPCDQFELLDILSAYCELLDCSNLLPRVVRIIDLNDDLDILENVNKLFWVNVVDLIFRQLLEHCNNDNKKNVIIYNERSISDLCSTEFSLKLLFSNLVNS